MRMIAAAALLLLVSCSEKQPSSADGSEQAQAVSSEFSTVLEFDVGPKAAALAYAVAQHSPLLSDAQRTAIAQNFHGAPIDGEFAVHSVTADRVSCRTRTQSVGEGIVCAISYSATQTTDLSGEDATFLYDALGAAGVEPEGGMSHLERTVTKLACTVDDKIAQTKSSTGDEINGFACTFSVG